MSELLETIELQTGDNPAASIIWMHGLGADGNDFVPIVNELELDGVCPIRFVFPHAPMQPVTITRPFSAIASPIAARLSSLAESRNPQVLTSTTSAPS